VELVDARKKKMGEKEALALAEQVDVIYATKGTRVFEVDLRKGTPDAVILRDLLIGPSGNLRAPTLRAGKTLLVGFNEATYTRILAK
jgi:arsenate reductase-like glutaredoxin family protein